MKSNLRRVQDEFRDGQRDVSYGELSALGEYFDEQLAERGVTLDQDDYDQAFFDFVDQYVNGNDDPQVNLEPLGIYDSRRVKDSAGILTITLNDNKKICSIQMGEGEVESFLKTNYNSVDWQNFGQSAGRLHFYANIDGKNYFEAYYK